MRLLALDSQGAAPMHLLSVSADLQAGRLVRLGRRETDLMKTLWLIGRAGREKHPVVRYLLEKFRIP